MKKLLLPVLLSLSFLGCASVQSGIVEEVRTSASTRSYRDPQLKKKDLRGKTMLFYPLSGHVIQQMPTGGNYEFQDLPKLDGEDAIRNEDHLKDTRAWAKSFNAVYRKTLAGERLEVRLFPLDSLAPDSLPVPDSLRLRGTIQVKDAPIEYEVPSPAYVRARGANADFILYLQQVRVFPIAEQARRQVCGGGGQYGPSCYSYDVKDTKETELEIEFHYTLWDNANNRLIATGFFKEFTRLSKPYPLTDKVAFKFTRHLIDLIPQMKLAEQASNSMSY